MGQITSLYVYKVIAQASPGTETHDLVEALGLNPNGPIDESRMVSSDAYYHFFAALADRDPTGQALSFRIGASMRSDDYGAFGLAWKSAPNLRGSYIRSERYGRVLGSAETYTLEHTERGTFFSLHKLGDGSRGMHLSNEASLAAVVAISEEVSSAAFVPLGVYFKHKLYGDHQIAKAHFGCPVHYGSNRDAVLIRDTSLDVPNRLGDQSIAQFFDRHLEEKLAGQQGDGQFEQRVRRAVSQALSEGVPTLTDIARSLGIGARTLQRRLSEDGYSFQTLVDHARRDLAQSLLSSTNYSLAEVAFLTGFSEQSGFTRAFKRWSGETPRSYRLAAK